MLFSKKIKEFIEKIIKDSVSPLLEAQDDFSKSVEASLKEQKAELLRQDRKLENLSKMLDSMNSREIRNFFTISRDFKNENENKKTYWQGYPKATGNLRIIQLANNALLKRFKIYCDEIGAQFWLHGGSLVGSLRHKGFVPWDDDIDIAMMRKDFENVKNTLNSENGVYRIQEYYYIGLACRSYRFVRTDIDSNCFVDIFVYDNYELRNESEFLDWKALCKNKLELKKIQPDLCVKLKSFPQEPLLIGFTELKSALDDCFERYISDSKSQDEKSSYILWGIDNNYEDESRFAWNYGRIFKRNDIFPLKSSEFEGEKYSIPNNFDKYTFAEYGIAYDDLSPNFGQSIHLNQYFRTQEQLDLANKLIYLEQS